MEHTWFVYILECADGTLYIGITNDLQARIDAHNCGKGAKYTRGRAPVVLKAFFEYPSRAEASKAEYALKKLPKHKKLELIANPQTKTADHL